MIDAVACPLCPPMRAMTERPPTPLPLPEPENALATEVLRQFRIVFSEVRGHFQQVEKVSGIGGAQVWALSLVSALPGLGVTDLARRMNIHQSTASNLVRQLLRRGLIRTEKSAADKRNVHLYVVDAGQALLDRTPAPHEGVLPHALRQQSDRRLKELQRSLAALIHTLQADTDAGAVPLAHL